MAVILYLTMIYVCIGATLALARIMYWLQLTAWMGPIVLNMARVVPDIITTIVAFLIILTAFSTGIFYFIIPNTFPNATTSSRIDWMLGKRNDRYHYTDITEWPALYGSLMENMAWTILNPGPSDIGEETVGESNSTATLLFATYQILVVIIMLNLLIAMMNATIQRLQDKKHLYWKFSRTSIWLEFMRPGIMLPPPLLPLSVAITLFLSVTGFIWWVIWWIYRTLQRKDNTIGVMEIIRKILRRETSAQPSSSKKPCKIDPDEEERREKHATLMENLITQLTDIDKYRDNVVNVGCTLGNVVNDRSIKVKRAKSILSNNRKDESFV